MKLFRGKVLRNTILINDLWTSNSKGFQILNDKHFIWFIEFLVGTYLGTTHVIFADIILKFNVINSKLRTLIDNVNYHCSQCTITIRLPNFVYQNLENNKDPGNYRLFGQINTKGKMVLSYYTAGLFNWRLILLKRMILW